MIYLIPEGGRLCTRVIVAPLGELPYYISPVVQLGAFASHDLLVVQYAHRAEGLLDVGNGVTEHETPSTTIRYHQLCCFFVRGKCSTVSYE